MKENVKAKKDLKENVKALKDLQERIEKLFPRLCCPQWHLPLSVLFPPSKNKRLERFRLAKSHADLPFYLKDEQCKGCKSKIDCRKKGNSHLFAIIECGGFQHKQEITAVRDKKKQALCAENNTGYGGIINLTWRGAFNKTFRNWVGKVLYGRFNRREERRKE